MKNIFYALCAGILTTAILSTILWATKDTPEDTPKPHCILP